MVGREQKTREELGDQFLSMVGFCILQWAYVDDALFAIFRRCVGPYEQSAIIYYRIDGLNARFGLTDEVVKSVLPKPTRKSGGHHHPSARSWKSALAGYNDLLGVRRRIAHHPLTIRIGEPVDAEVFDQPAPSWYEIYVGQHERRRQRSVDLPPLGIKELQDHAGEVGSLRTRLHTFYHGILVKHVSEYPQQPAPLESGK